MSPDTRDIREEVRNAREQLLAAQAQAEVTQEAAGDLSSAIGAFRDDTARRLSPWRMVAITAVGAFVAGFLSLTLFVGAAATCTPGDGGYCTVLAPQSEAQDAVVEQLLLGTLAGVEHISNGGTLETYLAGEAAVTAQFRTVIQDDGDGTYTILAAEGGALFGLDDEALRGPAEDSFPDPSTDEVLTRVGSALATGQPAEPLEAETDTGQRFITRVIPVTPTVALAYTSALSS